jgi:hypothetical protein
LKALLQGGEEVRNSQTFMADAAPSLDSHSPASAVENAETSILTLKGEVFNYL